MSRPAIRSLRSADQAPPNSGNICHKRTAAKTGQLCKERTEGETVAQVTATIPEGVGLHARPAALFVQATAKAPMDVSIGRPGDEPVNAKSILSVMGLGAKSGEEVVLTAEGDGAEQIVADLAAMIETSEE